MISPGEGGGGSGKGDLLRWSPVVYRWSVCGRGGVQNEGRQSAGGESWRSGGDGESGGGDGGSGGGDDGGVGEVGRRREREPRPCWQANGGAPLAHGLSLGEVGRRMWRMSDGGRGGGDGGGRRSGGGGETGRTSRQPSSGMT